MAINYELIYKGAISLGGGNFEPLSAQPLDSRTVVPTLAGLQNYIDNGASYEGMIVYDEETKKHYQVATIDGVLSYRQFGLTEAELNDIITNATTAAMEFKGATATLPENPAKGDMYKVAGENISIKIDDVDAKLGDSIVYDGAKWFLIPSGDDIEDTWRPVDGVNNDATLKFVNGDKTVAAVAADGTIKYNHATVAAPELIAENEQTRTYITAVETDGYGHITGYKTATENVEDTNTEYTFESQVDSSSVYFNVTPNTEGATEETIYVNAYSKNEVDTELAKKVDKVTGYSLVADDEIARLAEVDNYDDKEVRGLIGDNADAISELSEYVGTIPNVPGEDGNNKYADLDVIGYINKKAQETLAAASGNSSETAASVKGQLDDYIGENNTRVKAIEDDVAAIKDPDNGILKQAQNYADGLAGNYDEAGAAAGVKSELETEIAKKVDKDAYETDKATFAIADTVNAALDLKANAADVVANTTFEEFKTANTTAIGEARTGAVSDVEAKGYAVAAEVAETYATKAELGDVDKKFENYVTAASYAEDKAAIEKSIEDEAKARDDADKAFETRIGTLEGKFGTGEGTVEAQIAAAVGVEKARAEEIEGGLRTDVDTIKGDYLKAADRTALQTAINNEKARAEEIEGGLRTDVDAVTGRVTTAEGKITALEEASAKHAEKTYVETELGKKADKSVVDAMYTNGQIDTAVQGAKDYAKGLVDAIPDAPVYSLKKAADSGAYAAVYNLTRDGEIVGDTINIPKDMVVEEGKVVTNPAGQPEGTYIELKLQNVTNPLYINVGSLIEYVTSGSAADDAIVVAVSADHKVTATITDGKITLAKLEKDVQDAIALAKTALQEHQDITGKADKVTDATAGNFAGLDENGNLIDSGVKADDFALWSELPDWSKEGQIYHTTEAITVDAPAAMEYTWWAWFSDLTGDLLVKLNEDKYLYSPRGEIHSQGPEHTRYWYYNKTAQLYRQLSTETDRQLVNMDKYRVIDGEEAQTIIAQGYGVEVITDAIANPVSAGDTYTGNAITSVEWDSNINNGYGGLKFTKGTQFATKAELDAALEAFGGDLNAITDNNTKYTFEIPAEGEHAGKLVITEVNWVNGVAEGNGTAVYCDFTTSAELSGVLAGYYTKEEVDAAIAAAVEQAHTWGEF